MTKHTRQKFLIIEEILSMPMFIRACKTAGVKADRRNAWKFFRGQGRAFATVTVEEATKAK